MTGFRLHDARHAHVTHILANEADLHVLAERMGHQDMRVTSAIYSHLLESQAVGAMEKFATAVDM